MEFLTQLWLPILLSAVFVFVVSSVFHMAIPIHKDDYKKLPGEEKILELMRSEGVEPASYMFPCASCMKDAGSPEMLKKYEQGPLGFMTVMPSGSFNMGKSLVAWFLYSIVIGVAVAYAAWLGVSSDGGFLAVFRQAGTVAIVGYALTHVVDSIWKGQTWVITMKFIFEGVVYGLVTAATFAWLWPDVA